MTRRQVTILGVTALVCASLLVGLVEVLRPAPARSVAQALAGPGAPVAPAAAGTVLRSGSEALSADIAAQQARARANPSDYAALAQLGLDYVQAAKISVDPSYYPKAEGVLARSLALNSTENFGAMAGEAALNSGQHHFIAARDWAQRGLAIDSYNATLYGLLDDADTQLGRYAEATAAVARMNELRPGVAAFTRAEYDLQLRGRTADARSALQRAEAQASQPADRAFVRYYLGDLDFTSGDPAGALAQALLGLRADPQDTSNLEEKAKAEAALGQVDAAVRDYASVVARVPQPQYVIEAGEYLQSIGRQTQAQQQYALFDTEARLFAANGVALDTDPTLFYADHGDPARALAAGVAGIAIRPFIEMDDAYAWALHVNGRNAEALTWEIKAMALGTRDALFFFHAGMIEAALGRRAQATTDLTQALSINPHFNPLQVPDARAELARLA